jgi:hypothetical protein
MKKTIIGVSVGALILFIWQFITWGAVNLHSGMQQHTPKQAEILKYLGDNLEEGFYMLPVSPPGTSAEEMQKLMEESNGKPWAQIYYHKALNTAMGMNLVRGIVVDLLAVFLLVFLIQKMGNASFQTIVLSSLSVGLIGYLSVTYVNAIWFEYKTLADLVDAVVSWGLIGLWLGFWLRRD